MKFVKTAILCLIVSGLSITQSQAQSMFKDIFNKVTKSATVSKDITGRWTYQGSACSFKSDNILKQAGSVVAADQIEKQFDEYLSKVGIHKGVGEFIFNKDKSYKANLGKVKFNGNYTLNESATTITLTYMEMAKINASIERSGNSIKLLFDADSLLKLLKTVSSVSGNSTMKAISSIADAYDGVQLGFDLQKQ